jgi:4-amino-4-deoxy-L-arabinose transferase-like glycosyltransferase
MYLQNERPVGSKFFHQGLWLFNESKHSKEQRYTGMLLGAIVGLSLVLRLVWAVWYTGAIEPEGAEYARIAENLRNGIGYVGIASPGPQVIFPPLYPIFIATVSFMTGDYEWASRLISIISGAVLPLPLLGIASRLYNRRTGLVASLLAALHPFLINLSATCYSESLYFTLLFAGIYLVLRGLDKRSLGLWFLVGILFGLSYLTRPEALGTFAMAVVFSMRRRNENGRIRLGCALAAAGVFIMLASPYVTFLYRATGQLRLEGKSAMSIDYGKRILAGQSSDEAKYSINEKLEGTGLWMRPFVDMVQQTRLEPLTAVQIIIMAARGNGPRMLRYFWDTWLGGPVLAGLAMLGFFCTGWSRTNVRAHLFFLLAAASTLVGPLTVPFDVIRYAFVLVPLLVIWGGAGLVQIFRWSRRSTRAVKFVGGGQVVQGICGVAVAGLFAVAVLLLSFRSIGDQDGGPNTRVVEEVAAWIRKQQNHPVKIMTRFTNLAFHAGAQWTHFPYTSPELALRFLVAAKVDYVVLLPSNTTNRWAYYQEWWEHGIPDSRAELVYVSNSRYPIVYKVYRWR